MEILVLGVVWLVLSALAGVWAERKGHNGAGFVLLAALLSPLVGLIAAAAVADRTIPRQHPMHAGGVDPNLRPCPHCAEPIQRAAVLCRFCRLGVPVLAPSPQPFVDPSAPMMPGGVGIGRVWAAIGIVVVIVVAILGGVSQLGSSANTTFTTISDSLGEP